MAAPSPSPARSVKPPRPRCLGPLDLSGFPSDMVARCVPQAVEIVRMRADQRLADILSGRGSSADPMELHLPPEGVFLEEARERGLFRWAQAFDGAFFEGIAKLHGKRFLGAELDAYVDARAAKALLADGDPPFPLDAFGIRVVEESAFVGVGAQGGPRGAWLRVVDSKAWRTMRAAQAQGADEPSGRSSKP